MIKVTMRCGNDALNAREYESATDVREFKTIWDAIQFVTDETSFQITTGEIMDAMDKHGLFFKRHLVNNAHKWISIKIEEAK